MQIPFRREDEYLVGEHFHLRVFQEILRPGGVLEDLQQFAQPSVLPTLGRALAPFPGTGFLVTPVGGDAEFRDLVHLVGADLDFYASVLRSDHPGVD